MEISVVDITQYGKINQQFSEQAVRAACETALNQTANEAEKLFNDITGTWQHDTGRVNKPASKDQGGHLIKEVFVNDEIFFYLDEGTRDRYVSMHPTFRPKTQVGVYKSGAGGGYRKPVGPKKTPGGIDARGWTDMMAKDMQKELKKQLDSALSGMTGTGGG